MAIFTNQASLSYNNTVTNSNIVVGNIVEALTLTKTAVVDRYSSGDSITYVVSIVNSGVTPYTALTLNDNLGAYLCDTNTVVPLTYSDGSLLYYADGVLQPTPTTITDGGLTVTGITVPAGGSATIIYQVTANSFAPLAVSDSIVNTVTLNGGNLAAPLTASEVITPIDEPILSIFKSLSPSTISENGQLTYTFLIQNTGNTATSPEDALIVTDTFDPLLENITVTYNGNTLQEGTGYTYENGVFSTVNGVIEVPEATYIRNEDCTLTVDPGVTVITVTGTVGNLTPTFVGVIAFFV